MLSFGERSFPEPQRARSQSISYSPVLHPGFSFRSFIPIASVPFPALPRPRSDLSGHLGALQDYFVSNGVIPSLTELGKLWGIAGRAWTHRVVTLLKEDGFLE